MFGPYDTENDALAALGRKYDEAPVPTAVQPTLVPFFAQPKCLVRLLRIIGLPRGPSIEPFKKGLVEYIQETLSSIPDV